MEGRSLSVSLPYLLCNNPSCGKKGVPGVGLPGTKNIAWALWAESWGCGTRGGLGKDLQMGKGR